VEVVPVDQDDVDGRVLQLASGTDPCEPAAENQDTPPMPLGVISIGQWFPPGSTLASVRLLPSSHVDDPRRRPGS
jgi:hypothetical protein